MESAGAGPRASKTGFDALIPFRVLLQDAVDGERSIGGWLVIDRGTERFDSRVVERGERN